MNALAAIATYEKEDLNAVRITATSFIKRGIDVVLVVDKPVDRLRPVLAEFPWIASSGTGVGLARDAGLRYGLERGYDCIMLPDSHVYLMGDPGVLCSYAQAYGAAEGLRLDAEFSSWPTPTSVPWHGRVYSPTGDRYDQVFACQFKPWSYEPLTAFSRKALQALADVQSGRLILGEGFGFELPDLVLSINRLGFKLACTSVPYVHRHSKGTEEFWTARWRDPRQHVAYSRSRGAFVLKHVPVPCQGQFWKDLLSLDKWQVRLAIEFNKHAVKTTGQVYKEMGFGHLFDCPDGPYASV